jgi:hypothetical protein
MTAKPLLPQQPVTQRGDAPSRELLEIIQRIVADTLALNGIEATNAANAPGDPPRFFPRAWVNFNGQGTVAIRASGNVSSVTDLGVGVYRVNFTTAMPDANYAVIVSSKEDPGVSWPAAAVVTTAAAFVDVEIRRSSTNVAFDPSIVCVTVFR